MPSPELEYGKAELFVNWPYSKNWIFDPSWIIFNSSNSYCPLLALISTKTFAEVYVFAILTIVQVDPAETEDTLVPTILTIPP